MPSFFLAKSDPDTYSITDLVRDQKTVWDGVHNFQAIAVIRQWQIGDYLFIYHSQGENCIVGLAEVIGEPYLNLLDLRTSWVAEIQLIREFSQTEKDILQLKKIKATGLFPDFNLVRHSRLSVMTCPDNFVNWVRDSGIELN